VESRSPSGLCCWYELFSPSEERGWANVDEAAVPIEEAREGDVVPIDTVPPPDTFNMVFQSAAASAAPATDAGAAPDAGAVPAPEAAAE
jgi:hypothetical protein